MMEKGKGIFKLKLFQSDSVDIHYYEERYHVIVKKPDVEIETHTIEPANAPEKEYLKINPRQKDPDYYRQGKRWFYYGNGIEITDEMVINDLDNEFLRQYKSC